MGLFIKTGMLVCCLGFAGQLDAAHYRSSALGWNAGQDVTKEFGVMVKQLVPGDRLLLEGKYDLTAGPYEFPDDFVLEAVQHGGFNVLDSAKNPGNTFRLGHRNVMRNVTISHPNAPTTTNKSTNPKRGVDFHTKTTIAVRNKDDCIFEYCRFEGNVGHHIEFENGNRHIIRHCHVVGGYWAVPFCARCLDFKVQYTFFHDIRGEAIKTLRGRNAGTERAVIEHCIFQGTWRDGIDTTGGFKDSIVRDCVFRRNDVGGVGGGIDIKTVIETKTVEGDMHPNLMNKNITIERCQFIDLPNAIVLTMIDRAGVLTAATAPRWVPQEVYVNDCTFERTSEWQGKVMGVFLVKGGHTLVWRNLQRRGDLPLLRKYSPDKLSDEVNAVLNLDLTGTELPQAAPRPYDESVPFLHGPQESLPRPARANAHGNSSPEVNYYDENNDDCCVLSLFRSATLRRALSVGRARLESGAGCHEGVWRAGEKTRPRRQALPRRQV